MIKRLGLGLACILISTSVIAGNSFVIKNISVVGNKRVSRSTVLSYLSIHRGDEFSQEDSSSIIRSLYKTGFFDQVSLFQKGNTLVIRVKERPIISAVHFSGNSVITKKQLNSLLSQAGVVEGEVINPPILDNVKHAILTAYYNQGYYTAQVYTNVHYPAPGRATINIKVDEGGVAKISQIKIIGNKVFSDSTLLKEFSLSPSGFFSWFSSSDQYSRQRLEADLKRLTHYYMNRGYINFHIVGTQVSITPNKEHIYISVKISEGKQYNIGNVRITGAIPVDIKRKELMKSVDIKRGDLFSRQAVVDSEDALGKKLGNLGYANSTVQPIPRVNLKTHLVDVDFHLVAGQHVYVNRISFSGNYRTQDEVLRKQIRQSESGLLRLNDVKETKRNLENLGYIKNVEVKMTPSIIDPTQRDVNFNVEEVSSASANAEIGYSDTYGFMYGGSITDKNFRGSGKSVSLNATRNQFKTVFGLNYYDPNYTMSGISRGLDFHVSRTTPDRIKLSDYAMNRIGGGLTYGIPLSEYAKFITQFNYDRVKLESSEKAAKEIKDFRKKHGSRFNEFVVHSSLFHGTLDRALFPTSGVSQRLSGDLGLPIGGESLPFYKVSYNMNFWQPMLKDFILRGYLRLGYGNGYDGMKDLPFFMNYYAGGIRSIHAFEGNTVGPRDSNHQPIGGNVLTNASLGVILPSYLDSVRTTLFVDGGSAFENQFAARKLRYSAGAQIEWASPLGVAFLLSYAVPINKRSGDDIDRFQFSIGTSFMGV